MPHLTIEHANGLPVDQTLCDALYEALAAHPAIPHPANLKIRALPSACHRIGTDSQDFAHAHLALLPGRDDATKAALAGLVLDVMARHMPQVDNLSADISELSPAYTKRA